MNYDGSNRLPTPREEKEKLWMSEWLRQFQHQENGVFLRDARGIYDAGTSKILKEKFEYDIAASKMPIVKQKQKRVRN